MAGILRAIAGRLWPPLTSALQCTMCMVLCPPSTLRPSIRYRKTVEMAVCLRVCSGLVCVRGRNALGMRVLFPLPRVPWASRTELR